jgi:multicomponent Na+:H+ antiporter subunit B
MKHIFPAARAISRFYFAFSLLFGFYLMTHGHISHGAGFAGGIMITLGFLQALFVLGGTQAAGIINVENSKGLMLFGVFGLIAVSLAGYFHGSGFMSNIMPLGKHFSLLSSGLTVFYNMLFCFSVTGGLLLIILSIIDSDKD